MNKRLGKQTLLLPSRPSVAGYACCGGKKEAQGPLGKCFDYISEDSYFGQESWEKAESYMLKQCFSAACAKAKLPPAAISCVFAGDLLSQCTSSALAMRDCALPYYGLYGACSTMAEGLSLSAMLIDGGFACYCCSLTGSHFCTAERQFRLPLEYGGQRSPSAQWTVTGAGALILGPHSSGPFISYITSGCIVDAGITDASNMGAAMAPAAYDTLKAHFEETGRGPEYYDAIFTGDLGALGRDTVQELFKRDGIRLGPEYMDCGYLIYDRAAQQVCAGGSGCGCCASVLCGHILKAMEKGVWRRVLFAATGALMSPLSSLQGESIPGICHALAIEREGD